MYDFYDIVEILLLLTGGVAWVCLVWRIAAFVYNLPSVLAWHLWGKRRHFRERKERMSEWLRRSAEAEQNRAELRELRALRRWADKHGVAGLAVAGLPTGLGDTSDRERPSAPTKPDGTADDTAESGDGELVGKQRKTGRRRSYGRHNGAGEAGE